ncbi:sigma-54 interaction domain-containing protein [Ectothiorhodospira mobilis]|uniref:sigma-54 interaction domain-containing protein n=1 Tax=Ectothiorhodospira mobilis TaxID=195064 RepID=UPI001EE96452|nr:sigma-54 dependent transcriptional regulator [Ectothiorhodospira mobilis]MCG5535759.1 sigma-54 dependent transcriptional regulator [Ectothiorhodospira mobilis]
MLSLTETPALMPPGLGEAMDLIPEAFLIFDRDHRVVAANTAAAALLSRSREALLGRGCQEILHGRPGPCPGPERCPLEAGHTAGPGVLVEAAGGARLRLRITASPAGWTGVFLQPEGHAREAGDDISLVGHSAALRGLMDMVERVAATQATVLLLGESGVGKERVAEYLHRRSRRAGGPLVVVDCSTLGESLIEAELFGYEKGAFTGADRRKTGLFEAAHGGTLFIDEVGEMPLALQSKLLRALETARIRRVGGTEYIDVDVRVVAATHRDLAAMVGEGGFRQDLYYRLSAFPVRIPPLRERPEDILPLAEHFLRQADGGARHLPLEGAVAAALQGHDYPGNVRELKNMVTRAAILAGDGPLRPEHFAMPGADGGGAPPARRGRLDPGRIRAVLAACDGHRGEAARRLGVSERTLYRYLRRLEGGG